MKKTIPISTIFSHITAQLHTIYHDPVLCKQYAWWLLQAITGLPKAQLLTSATIALTHEQETQLTAWLAKMVHENIPIQYLLGSVPFNDTEILVEPPILIPRPETEEWCLRVVKLCKQLPHQNITILDLCSGSGCIAIALAKHLPQAHIIAVDISEQAIALGKKNALHNKVTNVEFIQSDLFSPLNNRRVDLIVSNPPYIPTRAWDTLDASVKNWEDQRALIAGDDGLTIIKQIITQAPVYLKYNKEIQELEIPQLWIEIDYDQAERITHLMHQAGFITVQTLQDLEGKDRVVTGSLLYVDETQKK